MTDRPACDARVAVLLEELVGLLAQTRRALQIATLAFVLLTTVVAVTAAILLPLLRP